MPPITVDPNVLSDAGDSIGAVGDEIAASVDTLAVSLPDGAMAGHDRAGQAFGQVYRQAAQALMNAGALAVDGGRRVGFGVQVSATNYSRADASSTIGGGATPLAAPPAPPGEFDAPTVPSPFGGGVAEPFMWSMVQMLVGDVWPNGDPAELRAAGTAWSGFSRTLAGIAGQLEGPSATIASQQIPEGSAIAMELSNLKQNLTDIATESAKLGVQVFEFAADVEAAQNAIRDLLSRLSPAGIFDGIQAIISGDALEELTEIAEDVRAVLDNLGRQADARTQSVQTVAQMLDDAVLSLQDKARKEFTDFLGEDVGNAVATVFEVQTNVAEAPLKLGLETAGGLSQLNPLRFAHDFEGAKETWNGVADTFKYADPRQIALDPLGAFEHYKGQLEGLAHVEDWTTDRPGLGPALVASEIGAMFIPGGPAIRGARAADIPDAGPSVRAAGAVDNTVANTGAIAGRGEAIADNLDNIGDNIPSSATPHPSGPAIPHELTEPLGAPRVGETPTSVLRASDTPTPHVPDSPTPHVADSTLGDRIPPDTQLSTLADTPAYGSTDAPGAGPQTGALSAGAPPEARVPSAIEMPSAPQQSAPTSSSSFAPTSPPAPPSIASHAPYVQTAPLHAPTSPTDLSPEVRSDAPGSGATAGHPPPDAPADRRSEPATRNGDGVNSPTTAEDGGVAEATDGARTPALVELGDGTRIYSLMDESSHKTSFSPEQLLDNQRVSDALSNHGVSRNEFIELLNKPTDSLTAGERHLINAVRDELPHPTRDTVMQKAIPPGYFDDAGNLVQSRADDYIMENNDRVKSDRVGGAVTVAGDTAHLSTPEKIFDGLRLDYAGSPFEPYDPGTHIIRFQADPGSSGFYDVPRNSDMGGDGSYDTWADPFTGNGFTKSGDDLIPEYIAKDITMRNGAEMWEVLDDGTQRLVAVLKDREWIPQGN